jgi:hypothetical protein
MGGELFRTMTTTKLIALKILTLGTTILYGWSFLWMAVLYVYGVIYVSVRNLGLSNSIYFVIFVNIFSLTIIGLIFFKLIGRTFFKLLIQDVGLIIICVPLFGVIITSFENAFDPNHIHLSYLVIFLFTVLIINMNDWLKTKKANRSSGFAIRKSDKKDL